MRLLTFLTLMVLSIMTFCQEDSSKAARFARLKADNYRWLEMKLKYDSLIEIRHNNVVNNRINDKIIKIKEEKFLKDKSDVDSIAKVDYKMKSLLNTRDKYVYLWCIRNEEVFPLSSNKELSKECKKSVRDWADKNLYVEMQKEIEERSIPMEVAQPLYGNGYYMPPLMPLRYYSNYNLYTMPVYNRPIYNINYFPYY